MRQFAICLFGSAEAHSHVAVEDERRCWCDGIDKRWGLSVICIYYLMLNIRFK